MACETCAGIFRGRQPPLYSPDLEYDNPLDREAAEQKCIRELHQDISQMAAGARQGCQICDITWRHFFRDKTPHEYVTAPAFWRSTHAGTGRHTGGHIEAFIGSGTHYRMRKPGTNLRDDYGPDALELEIGLNSPMDRDVPRFKSIAVVPVEDELTLVTQERADPSVFGNNTQALVRGWIKTCRETHKRCNHVSESGRWYPTRLLDLEFFRDLPDSDKLLTRLGQILAQSPFSANCRLIETAETPINGPYMTLSHRWQLGEGTVQTTRANVKRHKNWIFHAQLNKAFSDAVMFTRSLGVRYLWIDSLCIIQGDSEDWARESMLMGRVYSHSMLNLCATVGGPSLLQHRTPELIPPCIVRTGWRNIEPRSYVVTDLRFWQDRVYKSVSNQRAWIVQERWLAPRVLHFTFDQLLWECKELEAAEAWPRGLSKEAKSQYSTGFKQEKAEADCENEVPSIRELRHAEWNAVLSTYGRSEVTYEKDRLVALAGVSEAFGALLDDQWIAGLWRKTLPGDLLWYVDKARRVNKPHEPIALAAHGLGINREYKVGVSERLKDKRYQAPSWSWASVLGDIYPGAYLEDRSESCMIDILNISMTSSNPRIPYGRLRSGSLRLHGRLYPLVLDPENWTSLPPDRFRLPPYPSIHIRGQGTRKSEALWSGCPIYDQRTHCAHSIPDEPTEYTVIERCCFLPVANCTMNDKRSKFYGRPIVNGLCLEPTNKRAEYRRIGRINFMNEDCQLFVDGLRLQRKEESGEAALMNVKALSLSLDECLYESDNFGVLTII